jgi:uncharacterized protein (DUF2267 family)
MCHQGYPRRGRRHRRDARRGDAEHPGQIPSMADEFSTRVRTLAGLADDHDVERVTTAVLATVGEQLSGPAARRLAEGLPEPFARPLLQTGELAEPKSMDDFYAAVAERSGFRDAPVAPVLRALAETADREAVASAREQLPSELGALLLQD